MEYKRNAMATLEQSCSTEHLLPGKAQRLLCDKRFGGLGIAVGSAPSTYRLNIAN